MARTAVGVHGGGSWPVGELVRAFAACVGDRVRLHGLVSEPDVLDAYARAAVFVMPSIAELQNIATMEAMAASTPVIAADAMALPHLARPGRNGQLYPPGDVLALTAHLGGLLADPALRRRMGTAGRDLVADHALTATLTTFEHLYREGLDRTPVREPQYTCGHDRR